MKAYVLGINYFPEKIGIAVYTTEMCEYMAAKGHDVSAFTGFPYYPEWKISEGYGGALFRDEIISGVPVKRSYVYVPEKVSAGGRILHEFSFIVSSFFRMLFAPRPDVIIAVLPPLGLGLSAYALSLLKRAPFVVHIQDLQPDAAADLGMIRSKTVLKLLYRAEKFIYDRASLVSTISGKMREKVMSKGIDGNKLLLFPNWADFEAVKPLPKDNKFRKEHGLAGKFVVLYSGNIGEKQGLDVIVQAAEAIRDRKDIVFVIAGHGAYRKTLEEKVRRSGAGNVMMLPVQPKEMLPYMISAADACLMPQKKNVKDIVMPSKLLAILASGRPVIAGAHPDSELAAIFAAAGCGILVEPENPGQLAKAVLELAADPRKGEAFGSSGRAFAAAKFSKQSVLDAALPALLSGKLNEK